MPSAPWTWSALPGHEHAHGSHPVQADAVAARGDVRAQYDVSSMRWLIHAAAPCPVPDQARDARLVGAVRVRVLRGHRGRRHHRHPPRWLERAGTVGKAVADERGHGRGRPGRAVPGGRSRHRLHADGDGDFEYKGDPEKTAATRLRGFFTVGDIGFLDEDGFLFLCDRKSDMIISGGANIYPAEIEAEIISIPRSPTSRCSASRTKSGASRSRPWCSRPTGSSRPTSSRPRSSRRSNGRLAKMKWPKSIDFVGEMPRDPSGKLLKRRLRDPYWARPHRRHLSTRRPEKVIASLWPASSCASPAAATTVARSGPISRSIRSAASTSANSDRN